MINNVFIFVAALMMVIKGATMSTNYAARLAGNYHLSEYTVGFFIVAIISILPEAFISIQSAINGVPAFGLGTLLGSNVADLTLVFAIVVFYARKGLRVESKILKSRIVYPVVLLLPLIFGFDGHFSRPEGLALILVGGAFYYMALKNGTDGSTVLHNGISKRKSVLMLLLGMAILLFGAHFVVTSATAIAESLGISSVLIGLLIVGLGTTVPELFFSLESVKKNDDSLAVGDIFGTVLADATILVGILALIQPFYFPQKIIYVTGVFMVIAAFLVFHFMRSGRTLTRKESMMLFVFWLIFVAVELLANT